MDQACLSHARAEQLRSSVRAKYREVAVRPDGRFPYEVGRTGAEGLGYDSRWLDAIPDGVVSAFVGVGNPFAVAVARPGDHVLDVGCGSGLDVFVAGLHVGRAGRVVGVDLTPEMLERPARAAGSWPLANVEFQVGGAEALPYRDASFDTVISNGALNLVPDKDRALREIHRVLRPGGLFAVADVLVEENVPRELLAGVDAWST